MFGAVIPARGHIVIFKGDRGLASCARLSFIGDVLRKGVIDSLIDAYTDLGPEGNDGASYMRVESRDTVPEEFWELFDLPEYGIYYAL